jgi:hypothetical protein
MESEQLDHTYVLNFVAKYLSRGAAASGITEAWRFPLIDTLIVPGAAAASPAFNLVTFVWRAAGGDDRRSVAVVGSFAPLWDTTPLEAVLLPDSAPSAYRAVTVRVPVGEVHTYKFMVGHEAVLDPINPQRQLLANGFEWSRFFTHYCMSPVSLESWEIAVLMRLTNAILPFTQGDARKFMDLYYFKSPPSAQASAFRQAFRLDQPVGAVNFIDNLLSREEGHRLIDYKICLMQIDAVLRQRFPNVEPAQVSDADYQRLYDEMASDHVDGWDTTQYASPKFFLRLLRRHTYLGAFSHPKYGGNVGGAGWAFLENTYRGAAAQSCFDWRRSFEPPLGTSADYLG